MKNIMILTALLIASLVQETLSATYYVDYELGSDYNNGTTISTPWKHSPGDSKAPYGSGPRSISLNPGDTIQFKGGVTYRGSFECISHGTPNQQITYDGNTDGTWGTGRAIIDGSVLVENWTECENQEDALGNPNWQNIWKANAPPGTESITSNMFQNNQMLSISQDPNLPDPFWFDDISSYETYKKGNADYSTLVSSDYFTQSDPNYWDGSMILIWVIPNEVKFKNVTGYVPSENKIIFEQLDSNNPPYTTHDGKFAMYNSIKILDVPGEYFFDNNTETIYLWPLNERNPNETEITASVKEIGISFDGHDYNTIQGFLIQKYTGKSWAAGHCVFSNGESTGGIIRDNEMTRCTSALSVSSTVSVRKGNNYLVENNYLHDNQRNRGIVVGGGHSNITRNNHIDRVGGTTIFYHTSHDGIIDHNYVENCTGVHGNGITLYGTYNGPKINNCLVLNNQVYDSNIAFTTEDATNLYIIGNVFLHQNDESRAFAAWEIITDCVIINNVIGRMWLRNGSSNITVKNNIIHGFAADSNITRSHNIYTSREYNQNEDHGWYLQEGESFIFDRESIFVDIENKNVRLRDNSPAIDSGTSIEDLLPEYFADKINMTRDIDGTLRPS